MVDAVSQPYYGLTQDQRKTFAEESQKEATSFLTGESFIPDESILARLTTGTATTEDQQKLQEAQQSASSSAMSSNFGLTGEEDFSTNTSEIYKEAYENLSSLKTEDPEQFVNVFSGLTSQPRLAYLYKELQAGNINDEEYAKTSLNILRQENPSRSYFTDNGKVYTWPTEDTGGTPYEVMLRPNEVWNMPAGDEGRQEDYFLNNIGKMGTSTTDFRPSAAESILNNPIVSIAGAFNPVVALTTVALKGATGQTLHASDYIKAAMAGVEVFGPELSATQAEAATQAADAGEVAVDKAIDAYNETAVGLGSETVTLSDGSEIAAFGEFVGNAVPDLDAVYQAAYDASLATQGVSDIFMGIPIDEFTEIANSVSSSSDAFGVLEGAIAVADAFQEKDPTIIYNLLEDTTADDTTAEDTFNPETLETLSEVAQAVETVITNAEDERVFNTGDTPDMRETVVDLEQPELASEDITADPVEEQVITQPTFPEETEETVVVQPTESTDNEAGGDGSGGADTGGGETGAGSSGTGVPETGSGIPGTSGSGGLAVEEGAVTPVLDTMSVPNPDFDPDVYDVYYEREIYRIALEETDPVLRERLKAAYEEYGGKHVDDLKAGKSFEEVYGDYPPDSIEVPYEEPTLDRDAFEAQYPDGYLSDGGTFSNIDTNGDGVVSDTEKFDYEHNRGSGQGGDPSEVVQAILDALRLEVDTPDPSTGLPTDTIVDIGTEVGPTDPAIGSGQEDTTTDSTGVPSDTTDTNGTIGDGGGGVGTDDGGGAGGGTTGGGAGSGEADSGAGAGEGEGDGSGSGVGDGSGTGTGTGEGSGDGSGSGSGNGDGSGSGSGVGAGYGTRTTDSLFGDMLQLETQIGSTQELLPFNVMSTPTRAVYKQPQVDPIQQFLQHQQEVQRLRNIPQRMLTNDQFLKRFEY